MSTYPQIHSDIVIRSAKRNSPATVKLVMGVAKAIRDAGEVSSLLLYQTFKGELSPREYQSIIHTLETSGLVAHSGLDRLVWIEPKVHQ